MLKARLKELYVVCPTAQWDAAGSEFVSKYRAQKKVDDIKLSVERLRRNGEKMIPPNEVSVEYPEQPSKPIKESYPEKPKMPELKKYNIFNKKKLKQRMNLVYIGITKILNSMKKNTEI